MSKKISQLDSITASSIISSAVIPIVQSGTTYKTSINDVKTWIDGTYHGSFFDTTTQNNSGATAANTISFNTTDFADGTLMVDNTKITISHVGTYNIQFSIQIDKTDPGTDQIEIWLAKNGQNVPYSSTILQIVGNNAEYLAAWNFLVKGIAGDYWELKWHSNDTTMRLLSRPASTNPARPAVPSSILTISQIQ